MPESTVQAVAIRQLLLAQQFPAMTTWAARHLPARLHVPATARLLGFAEHDIPILVAAGRLTPLGDPAANAPKWFCAAEVVQLAAAR